MSKEERLKFVIDCYNIVKFNLLLTDEEISELSGVSRKTLNNWKSGSNYPSFRSYSAFMFFHRRMKVEIIRKEKRIAELERKLLET